MKLGFIGAGVVGTALSIALSRQGHRVVAVGSRSMASAERLAAQLPGCEVRSPQGVADAADLTFVTTPDDAVAAVVRALRWRSGSAVVHCSGAASTDILEPARLDGAFVGTFHPLQTFASPEQALRNLPGTTFALEADEPLLSQLSQLATDLGGTWVRLRTEDKVLYHAAAVMASNYLVTLVKLATDLWQELGVDAPEATGALLPLLRGTLANLERVGLPGCLTGPISRGDLGTIERHQDALAAVSPEILEAYRLLGRQTIPIALAKRSIAEPRARELRTMLEGRSPAALPARRLAAAPVARSVHPTTRGRRDETWLKDGDGELAGRASSAPPGPRVERRSTAKQAG